MEEKEEEVDRDRNAIVVDGREGEEDARVGSGIRSSAGLTLLAEECDRWRQSARRARLPSRSRWVMNDMLAHIVEACSTPTPPATLCEWKKEWKMHGRWKCEVSQQMKLGHFFTLPVVPNFCPVALLSQKAGIFFFSHLIVTKLLPRLQSHLPSVLSPAPGQLRRSAVAL